MEWFVILKSEIWSALVKMERNKATMPNSIVIDDAFIGKITEKKNNEI